MAEKQEIKKKNYNNECLDCGVNFDSDEIVENCPECHGITQTYQQIWLKCSICGKDMIPDDYDVDGALFSEKGNLACVSKVLEAYYDCISSIMLEDHDPFDFYHENCLKEAIKREIERVKNEKVN